MNKPIQHIAVLVESSRGSGRNLIRGISSYAAEHEDWLLYHHEGTLDSHLSDWIHDRQGDGIITRITSDAQAEAIASKGIPTVDLLGAVKHPKISTVHSDNAEIAMSAADFFFRAGFSNFAFCGYPGILFSDARQAAFEEAAKAIGAPISSYLPQDFEGEIISVRESWHAERQEYLGAWLKSLTCKVAIFACNDARAAQLSSACRLLGIKVPEEVIILGVDNDDVICNMASPANSSIEPDYITHGRRGAEVLQHMIDSDEFFHTTETVPSKGLIERPSTDLIAFSNTSVTTALRLLRKQDFETMNAEQIAEETGVSRSLLDRGFREEIGHSVSSEIRRMRLQRIRYLLRYTPSTLGQIAKNTGFSSDTNLAKFFKSATGGTPGAFRASHLQVEL